MKRTALVNSAILTLTVLTTFQSALAMHMWEDVVQVPAKRLIENLEARLASMSIESDKIRTGDYLRINDGMRIVASIDDLSGLDGTLKEKETARRYEVKPSGKVDLPEIGSIDVVGKTIEEVDKNIRNLQISRKGKDTVDDRGFFTVTQRPEDRSGRALPKEKEQIYYTIARSYSIAAVAGSLEQLSARITVRSQMPESFSFKNKSDAREAYFRMQIPPQDLQVDLSNTEAKSNLQSAFSITRKH